eukprot:1175531-Prorocentrum_minimum.AAC.2
MSECCTQCEKKGSRFKREVRGLQEVQVIHSSEATYSAEHCSEVIPFNLRNGSLHTHHVIRYEQHAQLRNAGPSVALANSPMFDPAFAWPNTSRSPNRMSV